MFAQQQRIDPPFKLQEFSDCAWFWSSGRFVFALSVFFFFSISRSRDVKIRESPVTLNIRAEDPIRSLYPIRIRNRVAWRCPTDDCRKKKEPFCRGKIRRERIAYRSQQHLSRGFGECAFVTSLDARSPREYPQRNRDKRVN